MRCWEISNFPKELHLAREQYQKYQKHLKQEEIEIKELEREGDVEAEQEMLLLQV